MSSVCWALTNSWDTAEDGTVLVHADAVAISQSGQGMACCSNKGIYKVNSTNEFSFLHVHTQSLQ